MFDLLYPNSRIRERSGEIEGEAASIEVLAESDTLSEAIVEERLLVLFAAAEMSAQVGFVRNYPLKMFLPRGLDLSGAESDFVKTRAHADFLFFRIVDKRPLAVLEVDGSQHDAPVQRRRDELKDSIMAKAGIPLWRLRTNAYKPDEQLEDIVVRVGVLADSNGSATCSNVSSAIEG